LTQVLAVGLPDVEAPTVDEYVLGRGGIQRIPLFLCGGERIIEFRRPPIGASEESACTSNGAARMRYSMGFHANNLVPAGAESPADHAAHRPATDDGNFRLLCSHARTLSRNFCVRSSAGWSRTFSAEPVSQTLPSSRKTT